jgi:hypothetical protein
MPSQKQNKTIEHNPRTVIDSRAVINATPAALGIDTQLHIRHHRKQLHKQFHT